jgi:glutathione reductase (NADPH)
VVAVGTRALLPGDPERCKRALLASARPTAISRRKQQEFPRMADYDYDLFTIGAGSGGVRASRVSAAHGARVAVAEEHRVGGTCVIRGCVPKKMLVYGAHFAEDLQDAKAFGWTTEGATFDWKVLRDNVLKDVDRLNGLYRQTLENHGVEIIEQRATVTGPHEVTLADGTKKTARHILVATGARPHIPSCPGNELGITSNEAFHLDAIPRRILIAGAGYIANEFAGIFNEFGARVTLINRSDQLLRGYDESMRDRLLQISTFKGIQFRFNAEFRGIRKNDDGSLTVSMTNHDDLEVDCVMFATGRLPNTEGLRLEDVGVELGERGEIKVDEYSRTNVESIYAVGDVTDRVQLTPVAIREGQAFADTVFGDKPTTVAYDCVPSAVFSHPPIAGVGLTEGEARNTLGSVKVYQSDFRPMKNVLAGRNERSLYKMICDGDDDERIVGIHMIGPEAPEIMQAAAVAVKAGLTKADFDATVAIHPTMAEELVLMR